MLINVHPSAFLTAPTKKREIKSVVSSSGLYHTQETGLTPEQADREKASGIQCRVSSACAFGNEFVASLLFLVGNLQLRKAITISILSGKHNNWFGLEYE